MCNVVNMRFLRPFGVLMDILKSSKMGPHLVLILLKSTLFPIEKLLTSSPQNKIPFIFIYIHEHYHHHHLLK